MAVTKNTIVSCTCNCQCGGNKQEERDEVCAHVLPILNLLSILLNEGLAQHLLIELSNQWDVNIEKIAKNNETNNIRIDIMALLRADGMETHDIKKVMTKETIMGVLTEFSVCTEKRSMNVPPLPSDEELTSLRLINKRSVVQIAASKLCQ